MGIARPATRWEDGPMDGKMPMVPRVDKGECISCGVCVDICPAVFRFDADHRAEAYDPQGADAAAIQEAIDLCPVACIYWGETY